MPYYEFTCRECWKRFETLVSWKDKNKVTCPSCGSADIKEHFAAFAMGSSRGSGFSGGGASTSGGSCSSFG